jgi:hypothetical protein
MYTATASIFRFKNAFYFTSRSSKWYIKRDTSQGITDIFRMVNIRVKLPSIRTRGQSLLDAGPVDHHADNATRLVPPGRRSPTVRPVMSRLGPRNQSSPNKKSITTNDAAIVFPNTCCGVPKKKKDSLSASRSSFAPDR